jgi:enoyl-CoA hydratase
MAKVRYEQRDAVGVITVDNPPVNSLSKDVFRDLEAILDELEKKDDFRAVVVTGAGTRAFVAGAEISEFGALVDDPDAVLEHARWPREIFHRLRDLPCPVVAAVQANAVGGGWEFALLCDLVVADENARFGLPEVRLGTLPGGGGTQRLSRLIGVQRAKELMFLGHTIDAATAQSYGAVNRIAPAGTALAEAIAFGEKLAAMPAVAVREIKRSVNQGINLPFDEGLLVEEQGFLTTFRSQDVREGYRAFLEKRPAEFVHR